MRCSATALGTLLALGLAGPATGQVPNFAEVSDHELGERITLHHEMVRYLETLGESSDRLRLLEQGESWEGRPLLLAIVTAPENHGRLEDIQRDARRLADPRSTSPEQAAAIIARQPVIVWYGGSIHGFELSGSEGLLKLLEHLTTRGDAATQEVLRNAVVLIDPMLNPDGREAFAGLNHQNLGSKPNPRRRDWTNDFTSWQAVKFRTGHYYFDINRDWFAHTQSETRARAPTLHAWRPQVVIDAHEMGPDAEFYFDPAAAPWGPYYPQFARDWHVRFGQAYAAAFDSAGFEYMTRERYNYFYPGYTTSYGSYQGAVGMLYEQGSSRGLALERQDGSIRTLSDALEQQYVAAWAAARTAARNRETLLREYYEALRADVAEGRQGVRRYLIAPAGDPLHRDELADLLLRNGIEMGRLSETVSLGRVVDRAGAEVGRREFAAGAYVVEATQPRARLLHALLAPDLPLPGEFLAEARARVERDENPRFYDITAWSLPLLFNLQVYGSSDGDDIGAEPLSGQVIRTAQLPETAPHYAYLIDGRQAASLAALYHLKHMGHRASVLNVPTRIDGADVPGGTVIVRVAQNDSSIHTSIRDVAERYALSIGAVESGLSEPGFPALGSGDHVITAVTPNIAMLAEEPIQGYSFGWAWYTLDRQYGIPVTVLRAQSLAAPGLDDFNVLVIPSASPSALSAEVGEAGRERLTRWVKDGGTLVTIGAATDFAREELKLIALRSWYDTEEGDSAQRFDVPGSIVQVSLDPEHWLSAGYERPDLPALVDSDRIYLAPEGLPSSRQRVAARYAEGAPLKLSGHLWQESLERLPGAVFVYEERVERGRVIAFAEDPNFRGYARGMNRLFLNAVVVGPSAP
jgi:hypothetical protein